MSELKPLLCFYAELVGWDGWSCINTLAVKHVLPCTSVRNHIDLALIQQTVNYVITSIFLDLESTLLFKYFNFVLNVFIPDFYNLNLNIPHFLLNVDANDCSLVNFS